MKKHLSLLIVGAIALSAIGCGTPRDKSIQKMVLMTQAYNDALSALTKSATAPEKARNALILESQVAQEKAIKFGEEAIQADPTNAVAYKDFGLILQSLAKPSKTEIDIELFEKAISVYEKGLEQFTAQAKPPYTTDSLKNLYTNFNNSLALCYRDLSDLYATENYPKKDISKSIEYAKKSAESSEKAKDYVSVLAAKSSFTYAGLLHKYKKWEDAPVAFEKALDIHKFAFDRSNSDEVIANLQNIGLFYAESVQKQAEAKGVKMKSLGKDDKGNEIKVPELDDAAIGKVLNVYQESIKIAPDNWDLYSAMFQFAADYDKAQVPIDLLKAEVAKRPDDARGNEVLGTLLETMGKKAEAAPYIKKFRELSGGKK